MARGSHQSAKVPIDTASKIIKADMGLPVELLSFDQESGLDSRNFSNSGGIHSTPGVSSSSFCGEFADMGQTDR